MSDLVTKDRPSNQLGKYEKKSSTDAKAINQQIGERLNVLQIFMQNLVKHLQG